MRIILDGRAITSQIDGIGQYSLSIAQRLCEYKRSAAYSIILRDSLNDETANRFVGKSGIIRTAHSHMNLKAAATLGRLTDKAGAELYHSFFMFAPLFMRTPSVITIHDTMWLDRPKLQSGGKLLHMLAGWLFHRFITGLSLKRAKAAICVSHATLDDVARIWPWSKDKLHVIGEGVDSIFHPASDDIKRYEVLNRLSIPQGKYILHPTNGKPYKNTERVLQAFESITDDNNLRLIIVGRESAFTNKIIESIDNAKAKERIHFAGSVSGENIACLIRNAEFLVFPSLYEGFGLPVAEAMASGCAVLTSNCGALEETAGGAAFLVNPHNTESIATGMRTLAKDAELRKKLSRQGLSRAKEFDWDKVAEKVRQLHASITTG